MLQSKPSKMQLNLAHKSESSVTEAANDPTDVANDPTNDGQHKAYQRGDPFPTLPPRFHGLFQHYNRRKSGRLLVNASAVRSQLVEGPETLAALFAEK
jgi:hypothetical protein